eukprot:7053568-Pyramimonas_sp.AAC.1
MAHIIQSTPCRLIIRLVLSERKRTRVWTLVARGQLKQAWRSPQCWRVRGLQSEEQRRGEVVQSESRASRRGA